MSGDKLFVDTNIILYLLNGDETIRDFLNKKQLYISFVTQLELLGFSEITKEEIQLIQEFLSECKIIDINTFIKTKTIELRKQYKLKLPDSLVIATAVYLDIPLITADKQFSVVPEMESIIYEP